MYIRAFYNMLQVSDYVTSFQELYSKGYDYSDRYRRITS